MKLVITGTREGRPDVERHLDCWVEEHGLPRVLIVGCQKGVDSQAFAWGLRQGLSIAAGTLIQEIARWHPNGRNSYDPDAARARNVRMVNHCTVGDWCLAFPGPDSTGTWHCLARARARGLVTLVCPRLTEIP
jgi:hypothetical protein